ncbi:uncharacterized protein LOC130450484 [Diorhabda sublineata]|uniref:uncharacterized protein LOC130450484 n=1 Tax=Diorhabda sublineata TaxID=1163346 RepID=UPI0024E17977|nr:uncharacterized protein LOC130450484 [Diorhabda sublineata]
MSKVNDMYKSSQKTVLKDVNGSRIDNISNDFLRIPEKKLNQLNSPEIRCSPSPCVFDFEGNIIRRCGETKETKKLSENTLNPNRSPSRTPSPASDCSPRLGRRGSNFRRSNSPSSPILGSRRGSTTGYEQYQKSLLEVPICVDYGDPSSDDLSSEWDSDVPEPKKEIQTKVLAYFIFFIVLFKFPKLNYIIRRLNLDIFEVF